jgi:predicted dinucleotide-binding enzyme
VFNNIFFMHLASLGRPSGDADRSALPIAGDDADAKAAVTAFLEAIGYDAVDAGPLAEGRRYEPDTPAYGAPYGPFTSDAGETAPADKLRAALAAA